MLNKILLIRTTILFFWLLLLLTDLFSQDNIDNSTKAVFIFDIAKYIDYGSGFADSAVF